MYMVQHGIMGYYSRGLWDIAKKRKILSPHFTNWVQSYQSFSGVVFVFFRDLAYMYLTEYYPSLRRHLDTFGPSYKLADRASLRGT